MEQQYRIFRAPPFDNKLISFSESIKNQIDKFEDQLANNPYVGKPLGMKWFREKRIGVLRMYYLVYEEYKAVYIVALSGKKDQQKVINTVRYFLEAYREEIRKLLT